MHNEKTRRLPFVSSENMTNYSAWLKRLNEIRKNHTGYYFFSNYCQTDLDD